MNQTPTAWKVQNPSLTLCAFQLRQDITKGKQEVMDNANQLWEQCVALGEHRNIQLLKSLKTELRSYTYDPKGSQYHYHPSNEDQEATAEEKPYLDDWLELVRKDPQSDQARQLRFHSDSDKNGLRLMGEIYPLRIHDTYALDLTLRYRETVELADLSQLNPTDKIQASIGQTLLLFVKPVNVEESAYEDFANHCVAALVKETADYPQLSATGQLFGSPIFEYDNDKQTPREGCHILVWLDSHPETLDKSVEGYHSLLNLLCCRSKILYAYSQSRYCHDQALELYRELEQKVEQLIQPPEETLEELNQWLKEIPQRAFHYAKYLRDMEDHRTAITTNIENYTSKLENIKALSLPKDDLGFLQTFLDSTCKQFQTQIQVDLNYLRAGQNLCDQMTATICGMIEVKQAESDRNLQETLQANEAAAQKRQQQLELVISVVATGATLSSVSSQVASEATEKILSVSKEAKDANLPSYVGYSFLDIVFHLLVGVILATPVGIILWWWRRK
ncbi:hypothetical protein BJP34_12315 [Moorena producens PAL-8-15-08-1]|uniref:Uncharacterized protein n=1 Tax=Moorena producens PAL-8-15-08-1 TaxID=1458985 RepID=A0A1D8TR90_9CYAN|nr:hypothetical protein [Moorena producens]AOX00127.1 hypothetical protein BJP34_12315 [Moorena producens PAL-8-15-08-1]